MACGYFLGVSAGKREIVKSDVLRKENRCFYWRRGAEGSYFESFLDFEMYFETFGYEFGTYF